VSRAALPALLLLATCGCAGVAAPAPEPLPALRTDASDAGTAELTAAGARLVGATRLVLAADTFRERAELLVERRRRESLAGEEHGLDLSTPIRLRLEWLAERCRLRRIDTETVVVLSSIRCAPIRG